MVFGFRTKKMLNHVISNQSKLIKDLSNTTVALYNKIFRINFPKLNAIEYSGQVSKLRGCICLSFKKKQKKLQKTMFEVLQPNGYNDSVIYLYFDKSAKLIEDDLDESIK